MRLPECLVLMDSVGETADTSNLGTVDLSALPTAFVNAVFGTGTPQYATKLCCYFRPKCWDQWHLKVRDGVNPAGPLEPIDIKQNETYVFDVSDSSMAGIEFGFSASADNAGNNPLTVTRNGDAGVAGSTVTFVLDESHTGEVSLL